MRPKSIATVVSSLMRSVSLLILRSVDTTSISLMVRMNSVLPALKGPVMTILTVCIDRPALDNGFRDRQWRQSIKIIQRCRCPNNYKWTLNALYSIDQPFDHVAL